MNRDPIETAGRPARRSWFGRNWKWFVPTLCVGAVALVGGFFVLVLFLVFGLMESSGAYQGALAQARAHPEVRAHLGTPIDAGFLTTGEVHLSGGSGNANLAIPISGPDGSATVFVVASKSAGSWTYSVLEVRVAGRDGPIDLLADPADAAEAPERREANGDATEPGAGGTR